MFGALLDKSCRSNLVHVGTVVVLTTSQTTTTGMLAVLSYTTLSMGDVAAAVIREQFVSLQSSICETLQHARFNGRHDGVTLVLQQFKNHIRTGSSTYCLRVFEVRVGMATVVLLSLLRCVASKDWKWVVVFLRPAALALHGPGKLLGERAAQP